MSQVCSHRRQTVGKRILTLARFDGSERRRSGVGGYDVGCVREMRTDEFLAVSRIAAAIL